MNAAYTVASPEVLFIVVILGCLISAPFNEWRGYLLQSKGQELTFQDLCRECVLQTMVSKLPEQGGGKSGLATLIFFSLLFREKARKTTKKARIFRLFRTPKILGKEGKNTQKNKEFLEKQKGKEIQNSKEKKISSIFQGLSAPKSQRFLCDFCDCDAHRGPQKSQRFPRRE